MNLSRLFRRTPQPELPIEEAISVLSIEEALAVHLDARVQLLLHGASPVAEVRLVPVDGAAFDFGRFLDDVTEHREPPR